jgi:thiol-disulfide isomerase/thioredoxin
MNIIDNYYDNYMPSEYVSRLSASDFSSCGSLVDPKYKSLTTVILFYVPECRFCQSFATELTKFSKIYSSRLGVSAAAVDMSLTDNNTLIESSKNFPYKLGQVYPTIMIYYKGNPCSSYTSVRSASALVNFITRNIGVGKPCGFKFVPCE